MTAPLFIKVGWYWLASSAASVLAGSYVYVQKSWWSDIATDFHFDDGSDLDTP